MFPRNGNFRAGQLTQPSAPHASVLIFTLSEPHGGLFSSGISPVFQRTEGKGQRTKGKGHAHAESELFFCEPFLLLSTYLSSAGTLSHGCHSGEMGCFSRVWVLPKRRERTLSRSVTGSICPSWFSPPLLLSASRAGTVLGTQETC